MGGLEIEVMLEVEGGREAYLKVKGRPLARLQGPLEAGKGDYAPSWGPEGTHPASTVSQGLLPSRTVILCVDLSRGICFNGHGNAMLGVLHLTEGSGDQKDRATPPGSHS